MYPKLISISVVVLFASLVDVFGAPTNMLQSSVAYRTAVIQRCLDEANYVARQLELACDMPIQIGELTRESYISPPRMGFGAVIATTNYAFVFHANGKINQIISFNKKQGWYENYPVWARTSSLVNSNGAYLLATQWLNVVDVDVASIEKKHPHGVSQRFFIGAGEDPMKAWKDPGSVTNKTMLPIYDVTWGVGDAPPVKVTVFGPTKELLVLELNDISFSRRPPIVITNWEELINIPDPPKKQLQPPPAAGAITATNSSSGNPAQRPPPFKQRIEPSPSK